MRRIIDKIFLTLLLFLGLGALGVGIFLIGQTFFFVSGATHTRGKVVELDSQTTTTTRGGRRSRHQSFSSTTYRPVFEFQDAQGATHRVTESVGSKPPMFKKDEAVPVLYDPVDPGGAHINAVRMLWLGPGLVTALGAVFTLIGGFLWRRAGRKQQALG